MGTYDLTVGGPVGIDHRHFGRFFSIPILVDVPTIIANNATLTTNAKITAADIIALYDIPADTVVTNCVFEVITPGTAANTADIGLAGGQELFAGIALDAAAGTKTIIVVTVAYAADTVMGKVFSTTDTLDMQWIADDTIGKFVIHLQGFTIAKAGLVLGY